MYNGRGPASASRELRLKHYFIIFSTHCGHNSIVATHETRRVNAHRCEQHVSSQFIIFVMYPTDNLHSFDVVMQPIMWHKCGLCLFFGHRFVPSLRGHPYKVLQDRRHHQRRGSLFSVRSTNCWNSFPVFNKRLGQVWTEVFQNATRLLDLPMWFSQICCAPIFTMMNRHHILTCAQLACFPTTITHSLFYAKTALFGKMHPLDRNVS